MTGQDPAGPAPEPWGEAAETHSAVVYFAGDRAFKLKKPVSMGFLDFSSKEARAAACAREVELNRRFAPDVYLGTAEVRGPDGQVCDHLVVMRRMPSARRLSVLVGSREPVAAPLRRVARMVAEQHAGATRSPQVAEQGSRDSVRGRWADSITQTRQAQQQMTAGEPLIHALDEMERLAMRFLAGRAPLFEARIGEGRIVDGHGDLLADDIFCLEDGPRILDCLDFDDRLRWVDGLDDAAFLAMDLERLGAPELAEGFLAAYAGYAADPAPAALRHHYVAYRALVRCKVACLRAIQGDPAAGLQARRLAELAIGHLRAGAVTLVLVGGLPATGKSVLASAVAGELGFTVLRSDGIRKELAGLSPGEGAGARFGEGIYTDEWTRRTYAEMLDRAVGLLARGQSVIADASFTAAWQRTAAEQAASGASADLVQLRCTASPDLAARRMGTRGGPGSDADAGIARQMEATAEPWPDAQVIDTESGGTTGLPRECALKAVEAIRPDGPDYARHPVRPRILPD